MHRPWASDVLQHPQPELPASLLAKHVGGEALCRLIVDVHSGAVRDVLVIKSSGYPELDASIARTVRQQWKIRPGKWREFEIYIGIWSPGLAPHEKAQSTPSPGLMNVKEAEDRGLLLTAVFPTYPPVREWGPEQGSIAPYHAVKGKGVFDLRFDYPTGELREVHVVRSTGNRQLDGHAIGALKMWKAKPGSIYLLRVPIDFGMR
jgi:hypothetical protein